MQKLLRVRHTSLLPAQHFFGNRIIFLLAKVYNRHKRYSLLLPLLCAVPLHLLFPFAQQLHHHSLPRLKKKLNW